VIHWISLDRSRTREGTASEHGCAVCASLCFNSSGLGKIEEISLGVRRDEADAVQMNDEDRKHEKRLF